MNKHSFLLILVWVMVGYFFMESAKAASPKLLSLKKTKTESIVTHTTAPNRYYAENFELGFLPNFSLTKVSNNSNYNLLTSNRLICEAPTEIKTESTSTTGTIITWNGTGENYNAEYGLKGFIPGEGTVIAITGKTCSLTNLLPDTEYDYYLQSDCGNGESSEWIGPNIFKTQYLPYTVPFSESFDNGYPPVNWTEATGELKETTVFTSVASAWKEKGFAYVGSTGAACAQISGSGKYDWAFTPVINLGTENNEYQLEFDMALTKAYSSAAGSLGIDDTVAVVISTDGGKSWLKNNALRIWNSNTPIGLNDHVILSLAGYSGEIMVGFYAHSRIMNNSSNIFIDNIKIANTPKCQVPTDITISKISYSGAEISWTSKGTQWNIEYGIKGFELGNGTKLNVTENPYTLSNINPESNYSIYIQTDCGEGSTSDWAGPYNFTTDYAPYQLPFEEKFENGYPTKHWSEGRGILEAESQIVIESSAWTGKFFGNAGSDKCMSAPTFSTNKKDWAFTPIIDLGDGSTQNTLEFNIALSPYLSSEEQSHIGVDDTIAVVLSNDAGKTWKIENTLKLWNYESSITKNDLVIIDLKGYSGQVMFGFYVQSTIGNSDLLFYIDNIRIGTPEACRTPYNFRLEDLSYYSTKIKWESNSANWNLKLDTTGFDTSMVTPKAINSNPFLADNLLPDTKYEIYVQSDCGDKELSTWSKGYAFTTKYLPYEVPYMEAFDNGYPVQHYSEATGLLGDSTVFSSKTSAWTESFFGNTGQNKAMALNISGASKQEWVFTPIINLGNGTEKYQLEFDMALTAYNSKDPGVLSADDTIAVLISVDAGASWKRSNMLKFWNNETPGINEHVIIDLSAYSGLVMVAFYGNSTVTNSNVNLYIDNISIKTPPVCPSPMDISFSSVKTTAVQMNWAGEAMLWNIEYDSSGFTPGEGVQLTSSDTFCVLQNLIPDKEYDVYIQAACDNSLKSEWTGPFKVKTQYEPYTIPYAENFTKGYPAMHWTEAQGKFGNSVEFSASTSEWEEKGFANEGSLGAMAVNIFGSNKKEWAISPIIDLGADSTQYQLDFIVALTPFKTTGTASLAADDTITLVISTDAGISWKKENILKVWSAASKINNNERVTVDLDAYSGLVKIAFYAQSTLFNSDVLFSVDNLRIQNRPSCPTPTQLALKDLSSTSAELTWSSSTILCNIGYKETAMTQVSSTIVAITENPYILNELLPETEYTVSVQAVCSEINQSEWSDPLQFKTKCISPIITQYPYMENFDNITGPELPCGWAVNNVNQDNYLWQVKKVYNATSLPNSVIIGANKDADMNDWFFTPNLVFKSNKAYRVDFNYKGHYTFLEKLEVKYGKGQNPDSMAFALFSRDSIVGNVWNSASLIITPENGEFNVGFHAISKRGTYGLHIDDIAISETYSSDFGVLSVNIPAKMDPVAFVPRAIIANNGLAQSAKATMIIRKNNEQVYSSTIDIDQMPALSSKEFEFDAFTPELGKYEVTLTVTTNDDQNPANNIMVYNFEAMTLKWVYGFVSESDKTIARGPAKFALQYPEYVISIASQPNDDEILCGTWVDNTWYGVSKGYIPTKSRFITIDTLTGERSLIGFTGRNYSGLTFDYREETMYAIEAGDTTLNLFSINRNNGVATKIGSIKTSFRCLSLACNLNGELYTLAGNGNLYQLNKQTAELSLIGHSEINDIKGEQGLAFDHSNNDALYWSQSGESSRTLYVINTSTGKAQTAGKFDHFARISGFVLPYNPIKTYSVSFAVSDEKGNKLEKALITLNNIEKTTNTEGIAMFENLVEGEYAYSISKDLYKTLTSSLAVAMKDTMVNVTLLYTNVELEEQNAVRVYPNPSYGIIEVKNAAGAELLVYTTTGKLLLSKTIQSNLELENLSHLNEGTYMLQIKTNVKTFNNKVIIIKP